MKAKNLLLVVVLYLSLSVPAWSADYNSYIDDSMYIHSYFESKDFWSLNTKHGGIADIDWGGLTLISKGSPSSAYCVRDSPFTNPSRFKTKVSVSGFHYSAYVVRGLVWNTSSAYNHYGFLFKDNQVFGSVGDGSKESTVDLKFSVHEMEAYGHVYEAVFTPNVGVVFFIDGILKGSINRGFPTTNQWSDFLIMYWIDSDTHSGAELNAKELKYLDSPTKEPTKKPY